MPVRWHRNRVCNPIRELLSTAGSVARGAQALPNVARNVAHITFTTNITRLSVTIHN